jgi:hypothetical protein
VAQREIPTADDPLACDMQRKAKLSPQGSKWLQKLVVGFMDELQKRTRSDQSLYVLSSEIIDLNLHIS